MAFVMVLSYSRHVFLRFYLNAAMGSFLHGHVAAFEHFNAVPRTLLYDNLRSAVLERHADAIRFHPTLLELAAWYRFQPRPVAVARGTEKGRVERAIRFVRERFFAARRFTDLADLNAQALLWCLGEAAERRCPEIETAAYAPASRRNSRASSASRPSPSLAKNASSIGRQNPLRPLRPERLLDPAHPRASVPGGPGGP